MLDLPKVSLITPSFNQGKFIERTICSVLEQTYSNIEYIIIDGGSTDETVSILKKYSAKLAYWVSEKDNGQAHALNKGLQRCTGEIVAYINSDDYYNQNAIASIVNFFKTYPDAYAVAGYCTIIWQLSEEEINVRTDKVGDISFKRLLRYWEPDFCPPQPSIFFTREIVETLGFFDEGLKYTMDLDYWIRISMKHKIHTLRKNLSNYLIHPDSKSGFGDGFEKFLPERKRLSEKYRDQLGMFELLKYYKSYYVYPVKMAIKRSYFLR